MKNKNFIFGAVTIIVLIVSIIVSYILETDRIYTHFFYIPIALSAMVIPKYIRVMGLGFAILHLLTEYSLRGNFDVISLIRAGILISVSYFLHVTWHKERNYRQVLSNYNYQRPKDGLKKTNNKPNNKRQSRSLDVEHLLYPVTMMKAQLDNYIDINIKHGQNIADAYIAELNSALRECIRSDDQLLRVYEYVFIILLEHCDESGYDHVKERIYERIQTITEANHNPEIFPEPLTVTTKETTATNAKGFKKAYEIIANY